MSNPVSHHEDPDFHLSIPENLKQLSAQLGSPLDEEEVEELIESIHRTDAL